MQLDEPLWTSRELEVALGLKARGKPWFVDGIQMDSRAVLPGDLFVALAGEKSDGHNYLLDAVRAGAAGLVVDQAYAPVAGEASPCLEVNSTPDALCRLAAFARDRAPVQVIAVTGSVGKTSLVGLLRDSLAGQAQTHSSVRSYNNHVGVPLSLARMPRGSRYGVFELGMSEAGEIDGLASMVRPDVAVITKIAPAHLAEFDSVAGIAAAKAEVFRHVAPGGTAVIGLDHEFGDYLVAEAKSFGLNIITVSGGSQGDVFPLSMEQENGGTTITARVREKVIRFGLKDRDPVLIYNVLLALATVDAAGADVLKAALDLGCSTVDEGRGRMHSLSVAGGEAILIDDSYNANPASMLAAFDRLQRRVDDMPSGASALAVLGDMEELGTATRAFHLALADRLKRISPAHIYAVGPHMAALARAAGLSVSECQNAGHAAEKLSEDLAPGDVVLVKGSNKAGLGAVLEFLKREEKRTGLPRQSIRDQLNAAMSRRGIT